VCHGCTLPIPPQAPFAVRPGALLGGPGPLPVHSALALAYLALGWLAPVHRGCTLRGTVKLEGMQGKEGAVWGPFTGRRGLGSSRTAQAVLVAARQLAGSSASWQGSGVSAPAGGEARGRRNS